MCSDSFLTCKESSLFKAMIFFLYSIKCRLIRTAGLFLLLVASDIDTVTGKEGFEWRWIFEVTTQFSWDPKLLFWGDLWC